MLNYVEDRRIDYYVFTTSPGYKGYYHKMYDKYFHSNAITKALRDNTFGNENTLDNYMNRIINFTNKESDLDCPLPWPWPPALPPWPVAPTCVPSNSGIGVKLL